MGFSAAVSRPAGIHGENIVDMVPVTNPFLRDMLQTFLNLSGRKGRIDFDELGIQEVVALLNSPSTHLDAVLRDFGNRTQREDPVIHFYEDFLREYDARKKIQRGVFYTPQPVVSYIVRSVHELLQTEFGLEDGLADTTTWREMAKKHADLKIPDGVKPEQPFVQILDPATGTATFLVEAIEIIYSTLTEKWKKDRLTEAQIRAAWNDYVPNHLLPRLHGYELMMAPYAIAHMKIGLKLSELNRRPGQPDYSFKFRGRAHIYLTNALEPPSDLAEEPEFEAWAPALAHEARAVNSIKRRQHFTVLIGNPPYAVKSYNNSPWILALIDDFKRGLNETKINLDDDFIKFLRLAAREIERTGTGVVGMITNNIFLSGVTHRQMRQVLLDRFQTSEFSNLHGDSRYNEVPPPGRLNENVFDIQQGVAISVLLRKPNVQRSTKYGDVWGSYEEKRDVLQRRGAIAHIAIAPQAPYFFVQPKSEIDTAGYETWPRLCDWMPIYSNGIETHKDSVTLHFSEPELNEAANTLLAHPPARARALLNVGTDGRDWHLSNAIDSLRRMLKRGQKPTKITYRPFDIRYTLLNHESGGFLVCPRWDVMCHLVTIPGNLALVSARLQARGGEWDSCLVTRFPTEKKTGDSTRSSTIFPLRVSDEKFFDAAGEHRSNFSPTLLTKVRERLDDSDPQEVFSYIYALMHSPGYRSRYAEFLKIDFPRLPLTGNLELFRALARLGGELVALHLLESPNLDKPRTEFIGGRNPEVEKISWSKNTVWIDKAQTTGFKGVSEAVWNFHIGGYQVCQKWLKDRKGRTLSKDDIAHYHKIVIALAETIRLMAEIDKVIEKHGGWPSAFAATVSAKA
jgi:predicted helicase